MEREREREREREDDSMINDKIFPECVNGARYRECYL